VKNHPVGAELFCSCRQTWRS